MTAVTKSDLLARVVAHPEDDSPRMAYAAWLETNGDPARADLIRLQLVRARSGGAWSEQEIALVRDNASRWEDELPELPRGLSWGRDLRRGFLDTLYCSDLDVIADLEPDVLAEQPITSLFLAEWRANRRPIAARLDRIRTLVLRRSGTSSAPGRPMAPEDNGRLVALLGEPWLQHVTSLELSNLAVSGDAIAKLAEAALGALVRFRWQRCSEMAPAVDRVVAARWLRQLSSLEFEGHALNGAMVESLCVALSPDLEHLTLRGALDDAGFQVLATVLPPHLRRLDVAACRPGPGGLRALLAKLPAGCQVSLAHCALGDDGLAAYVASPSFAHETTLRVTTDNPVHDSGVVRLAESEHAQGLTTIMLVGHAVGELGARAMMTSSNLSNVRLINLERNPIGAMPLCDRPALEVLVLHACALTDNGMHDFLAGSKLSALKRLALGRNLLGPNSAEKLAAATGLPCLEALDLSGNALGTLGVRALCEGEFGALRELDLRDCGLDDEALFALLESALLSRLARLSVADNPVSKVELDKFRVAAAVLGCSVDHFELSSSSHTLHTIEHRGDVLDEEARAMLARTLRHLRFAEYARGAWLKICPISDLASYPRDKRERRHYAAYLRGARDAETIRGVEKLVIERWLCSELPESMSEPSAPDRPVERETAIAIASRLCANSDGTLHGIRPLFVPPGAARPLTLEQQRRVTLDFGDLAGWFAALFAPEGTYWAASGSVVWASDARHVALCWCV